MAIELIGVLLFNMNIIVRSIVIYANVNDVAKVDINA